MSCASCQDLELNGDLCTRLSYRLCCGSPRIQSKLGNFNAVEHIIVPVVDWKLAALNLEDARSSRRCLRLRMDFKNCLLNYLFGWI